MSVGPVAWQTAISYCIADLLIVATVHLVVLQRRVVRTHVSSMLMGLDAMVVAVEGKYY